MTDHWTLGPESFEQIRARLAGLGQTPEPPDRADAAVLILLRSGSTGPEVLAEQRAERAGDPWSGHVGLPGGRTDPSDRSLTETVLRELREEVGILPSSLYETPRLFDIRRARPSGVRVAVFADRLAEDSDVLLRGRSTEVDAAFWFPLRALDQATRRIRNTAAGEMPVEVVEFEGHVIWGFTLRVLQDFATWLTSSDPAPREAPNEAPQSPSRPPKV